MKFEGRTISPGKARGTVIKLDEPLSFLGGVDGSTGDIRIGNGGNVSGKVLVFPKGKGSTVGSFVMYDLKVHGVAPAAVINESAETIVATGAVISSIPMVDRIPSIDVFLDGDTVEVDADSGSISIEGVDMTCSVSSVIVSCGKVLMLKRPSTCSSFPDKWSLVSGKIEAGESPEEAARREIMEETSLDVVKATCLDPIYVRDGMKLWKVFPFRFDCEKAEPVLNEENVSFEWCEPDIISDADSVTGITKILRGFGLRSGQ